MSTELSKSVEGHFVKLGAIRHMCCLCATSQIANSGYIATAVGKLAAGAGVQL